MKNGLRNSIQRFICKDCNKSFTVRTNTITEHSKKSFETFFALSFKGNHKKSATFTMPRKAHKRGKDIHTRGLSHEQVCGPCGVNGNGLSVARISNLGRIGTKDLEFAFRNQIASDYILCCDGANAYRKFAN
ncbi:MAG: IS1 family transposase, partial [Treponema sp.]|nr:IS1 family transposase [Treponema sp.]